MKPQAYSRVSALCFDSALPAGDSPFGKALVEAMVQAIQELIARLPQATAPKQILVNPQIYGLVGRGAGDLA